MKIRNLIVYSGLSVWAVLLGGCGAEAPALDEPIQTDEEAVTADFTDASGQVKVRIKTCPWSQSRRRNFATCSVDTSFALVGGGAEVENNGSPGALLDQSYPDEGLTTWMAASKDQTQVFNHRLRAYAIGLQLNGVSVTTLRQNLVRVANFSSSGQLPNTAAEVPPGFTLIGGGALSHWLTKGLLLTKSFPEPFGLVQWNAEAKDHKSPETGTVDAIAIGIKNPFPNFGTLDVQVDSATTFASSGYGTSNVFLRSGYVLTSVGGRADWANSGRMLTDMIPFGNPPLFSQQGATITSKDHSLLYAGGNTTAFALGIRKL